MNLSLSACQFAVVVEFAEKDCSQVIGASSTDCLYRSNTVLCDGWRIATEDELGGGRGEFCQAGNVEVFVVDGLVSNQSSLSLCRERQIGVR